jgi:hypothetical protein
MDFGDDQGKHKLWHDHELDFYIDYVVNDAAICSRCIVDSTTPECSIIQVIAGIDTYPLHDSVFYINRVYDATNNNTLTPKDTDWLDRNRDVRNPDFLPNVILVPDPDGVNEFSLPQFYVCDLNHFGDDFGTSRTIKIFPSPSIDLTLQLTVTRTPLYPLTDYDSPEIPFFHHMNLIYGVKALAYRKHDTDTEDHYLSKENYALFEQCFGPRPSAKQLQWGLQRKVTRVRTYFK